MILWIKLQPCWKKNLLKNDAKNHQKTFEISFPKMFTNILSIELPIIKMELSIKQPLFSPWTAQFVSPLKLETSSPIAFQLSILSFKYHI